MIVDKTSLSRRGAILRLSGLALGAYVAPSLTSLSMARASGASGGSGGSGGSAPSQESKPSEYSRASIPSGIDNPEDCRAEGGTWNEEGGSCS